VDVLPIPFVAQSHQQRALFEMLGEAGLSRCPLIVRSRAAGERGHVHKAGAGADLDHDGQFALRGRRRHEPAEFVQRCQVGSIQDEVALLCLEFLDRRPVVAAGGHTPSAAGIGIGWRARIRTWNPLIQSWS
jgi:hypothetical protein